LIFNYFTLYINFIYCYSCKWKLYLININNIIN